MKENVEGVETTPCQTQPNLGKITNLVFICSTKKIESGINERVLHLTSSGLVARLFRYNCTSPNKKI